jgi:penicillin-binding protein 2
VNSDTPRLRLSVLGVVVVSLFAALFARLWFLQVMSSSEAQVVAESNRIRVVAEEAPRGRILDREGRVIVDNRISVQVTIDRSVLSKLATAKRTEVLTKVADALATSGLPRTVAQLEDRIKDKRFSPYVPVPIASDVPEDLKIWIDEHTSELPSVAADRVAVRRYPYGRLAAHVIGYTGKVTKEELDTVDSGLKAAKPYTLNDEIGKYGIEKVYEPELRGTPGLRRLEVDARGNPIRTISDNPPVPGDDVVLNLNIDLEAVAEQALQSGLDHAAHRHAVGSDAPNKGAVGSSVVIDPQNGGVLAMASAPAFSPSDFVDGISGSEWGYLNDPANHYPLNNWALQGQYAPGSTFKPFIAASGLAAGLITPNTTVHDTGVFTVPGCKGDSCKFSNDGKKAYGTVNLRRALTVSSDFYFYNLGAQFWIQQGTDGGPESLADHLKQWGFDSDTGVDLSSEQGGRVPSPAWLKDYCANLKAGCTRDQAAWRTGKNVNLAVGQGEVLVTPLQLASAYATLANGGTRWTPQLVREIQDGVSHKVKRTIQPHKEGAVAISPTDRQAIVDGLIGVTTQEGGTAFGAFSGFPSLAFPVAAKTGTAQVKGKAPTAVFGAFGPATDPHFAVSVFMEESGYGGSAAAPVARRLFDVLSSTVPLPEAPLGGQLADLPTLSPDPGDVRDR